jgi:Histidine kinase-, DNA gyrase B-, and HSP90-like ATPase
MKLNDVKPYFESSGQMEEHFFSIKDQGMIFNILRSKMYSNPILAICREITSNARDAHREVGKPDEPIHIHLPVSLEPEYRVKDFGPGISPDRMVNIFIAYTASTKRDDNTQTGGFGLGAKTPFSYSDTFLVTTVHEGTKYSYACVIDDTQVGKLLLLNKAVSKEPNSTEVAIQVKPQDFSFFNQWTEQACRHWKVKPIIEGGTIDWQTMTPIIEGKGWIIVDDPSSNGSWSRNQGAKLVIDGIEYPLELDALRKYADPKLIDSAKGTFVMYFGVGELTLSANREQIYLDDATQKKIRGRLAAITKEVKRCVDAKIDSFPDLWQANLYYRRELTNAFHNLGFLGKLAWKGNQLSNGHVELLCGVYSFARGKYSRKLGHDPDKLTRSISHRLEFTEGSQLYLNDLSIREPTPKHLKKAFENDPLLKQVQVVCPNDEQSVDDINKLHHLDLMLPKKLSSITKATGRAYTPPASRLLVFKFDTVACAFRQVSYDSMDEDTNDKVLCLLNRGDQYGNNIRMPILVSNKQTLSLSAMRAVLVRNPKISFYGVDKDTDATRVEEEFSDFEELDTFINDKILNNQSISYVEIKFSQNHTYHIDERMLKHMDKLEPLVLDKQSLFLMRLNLHQKVKKLSGDDKGLLEIYESVKGLITDKDLEIFVKNNPEWDIEKKNNDYEQKYPLLGAINTYNFTYIVDHVAHYVNMVDKI